MVTVRPIRDRRELEMCYDLWGAVFDVGRAFFQRRLDGDSAYRLDTTWGAWVDGTLASAVQLFPYQAYYGAARVTVGGIGSVGTAPPFRRRGLAQMVLRHQLTAMRAQGVALSLLFTGIPELYAPLGWHALPAGLEGQVQPRRLPEPDARYGVERAAVGRLPTLLADLYAAAAGGALLARVRDARYWSDSAGWREGATVWVARVRDTGRAVGYLWPGAVGDGAAECLVLPGHDAAAYTLWRRWWAAWPHRATAPLRIAPHHPWAAAGTWSTGEAEAMWALVDPGRFLIQIAPELSRRLERAGGWARPATATLAVGDSVVVLRLAGEVVRVGRPAAGAAAAHDPIPLTEEAFLRLVLLGEAPEALTARHPWLPRLFPEDSPFLWDLDRF